jgi:hypothetical protein
VKTIYLARRHPGLTHDQFVVRWRRHGALAMSKDFFANITTYVQAEVVEPALLPGATQDYDAVAYIVTQDHVPTQHEFDELGQMAVDEKETFEGVILPRLIVVDEMAIKAGPAGGTTAFLFFRDAQAAARVAGRYRDSAALRVTLDVRKPAADTGEMSALIPYAAVVEVSAAAPDALATILGTQADAAWRSADLAAVTRECVMWDRASSSGRK